MAWFEICESCLNVNDSMELPNTTIATLNYQNAEGVEQRAVLEVRGEVEVKFRGKTYYLVEEFPDALKDLIKTDPLWFQNEENGVVKVEGNYFELYCGDRDGEKYSLSGEAIDAEGLDTAGIYELMVEYINDLDSQKGAPLPKTFEEFSKGKYSVFYDTGRSVTTIKDGVIQVWANKYEALNKLKLTNEKDLTLLKELDGEWKSNYGICTDGGDYAFYSVTNCDTGEYFNKEMISRAEAEQLLSKLNKGIDASPYALVGGLERLAKSEPHQGSIFPVFSSIRLEELRELLSEAEKHLLNNYKVDLVYSDKSRKSPEATVELFLRGAKVLDFTAESPSLAVIRDNAEYCDYIEGCQQYIDCEENPNTAVLPHELVILAKSGNEEISYHTTVEEECEFISGKAVQFTNDKNTVPSKKAEKDNISLD